MPVFVTAADHGIGPALVSALRADGADVRAFARGTGDVGALRTAGAFVAVGDLDDEGHLDAAMTDAHTVVVPTATWSADPDDLEVEVATIARAARLAAVRRVVLVSLCGADPASAAPLLAAFGRAEEAVVAAGMQVVAVRTDGIVEHGVVDVVSGLSGCDDEVLAPVQADRLVAGLVALDAARSSRDDGHALFTALGEHATVAAWRRRLVGLGPRPDAAAADPAAGGADPAAGGAAGGDGGELVGRRWLVPDRRADLWAILAGRGGPPQAGADLWSFADGTDA